MRTDGITVVSVDGWHDDGWCGPILRGRVRFASEADELRFRVWVRPEDGLSSVYFSLSSGARRTTVAVAPDGIRTVSLPVAVRAGEELDFHLYCEHRLPPSGEDRRDLSFVLDGVEAAVTAKATA